LITTEAWYKHNGYGSLVAPATVSVWVRPNTTPGWTSGVVYLNLWTTKIQKLHWQFSKMKFGGIWKLP
jgi:hypothetical protein